MQTSSSLLDEFTDQQISGFRESKIALFCGAGISFHSGVPLARDIVRYSITKLGGEQAFIDKIEELAIPFEAIMEAFLKNGAPDRLLDVFDIGQPNTNHRWIAKMMKNNYLSLVITTNFDRLIEQALEAEGLVEQRDYTVLRSMNELDLVNWYPNIRYLVKIHGSINDRKELGITLEHVASHQISRQRNAALQQMFSAGWHRKVLVLGYSCSDAFDITPFLQQLAPPHKEVVYIKHNIEDSDHLEVKDIREKAAKNPFRNFADSLFVTCNTDRLVRSAWKQMLPGTPYQWKSVPVEEDWRAMIDDWVGGKAASDRSFILASLASFVQDYDLVDKFYTECIRHAENKNDWLMSALALSNQGINHFHRHDYDLAVEKIERSIGFYRQLNIHDSLANQLGWLGGVYDHHLRDFDRAMECFKEAIEIYEKIGNRRGIGNQLGNIGNSFYMQGKYEEAVEHWQMALEHAQETGNVVGELNQYERLGHYFYETTRYDLALEYLERGRNLASLIGRRQQEITFIERIAYSYDAMGKYQDAFNYYRLALAGAKEENRPHQIVRYNDALGGICERVSNYDLALQYYEETVRQAEIYGFEEKRADACLSLANIYFNLGRYKKGLEYIDQAMAIAEPALLTNILKRAFDSRAIALLNMGNAAGAIHDFERTLELEGKDQESVNTRCNLALAYMEIREFQKGHDTALEALKIAQSYNHKMDIGFACGVLGMACFHLNDLSNARKYQKQTLQIAIETGDIRRQVIVLGELALSEMKEMNFFRAYSLYLQSLLLAEKHRIEVFAAIRELDLGNLLFQIGHYGLAQDYYLNALQGFSAMTPPDEIYIGQVKEALERIERVMKQRGDLRHYDLWIGEKPHYYWPFYPKEAEMFHQAYLNSTEPEFEMLKSMGDWYYSSKNYEMALNVYALCMQYAENTDVLNNAGNAAFAIKEYEIAFDYFTRVCALAPPHANANYMLGHLYNNMKQVQRSAYHYQKSLERNHQNRNAWYNLGLCLISLEKLQEAEPCFQKSLEMEPEDAEASFALGAIAYVLYGPEEALRYYERSLEINPDQRNIVQMISEICQGDLRDPEKVVYHLEKLLKSHPSDTTILFNLAITYHEQLEQSEKARQFYERILEIEPQFDRANYCYALLLVDYYEDYQNALKYYNQALQLNPEMFQAHHNLGLLWSEKLDDLEKAKFHYESSLKIMPRFFLTNWKYGELLILREKNYDTGIRHLNIAIEENSSMSNPRILLIQVLLQHYMDYLGAEQACRDALAVHPDNARFWYLLGASLFHQQDKKGGIEALKRACSIDDNIKNSLRDGYALEDLLTAEEVEDICGNDPVHLRHSR